MNLTIDQFIDGLERSVRELPAVLAEWDGLDPVLQEEYAGQLVWMLASRLDVVARAERQHRGWEFVERIGAATSQLVELHVGLAAKMYIPMDHVVPNTSYMSTYMANVFGQQYAMAA